MKRLIKSVYYRQFPFIKSESMYDTAYHLDKERSDWLAEIVEQNRRLPNSILAEDLYS